MHKYISLIITLFLVKLISFYQTIEPSTAIHKNDLQIEIESLYSIQKEENLKLTSWSIPSALLRFGLFEGFEIQLNTPIIKEELWEKDHLIHSLNKFDDIQIGFSLNLWKEQKLIPEASIMVRNIIPTDSKFEFDKFGKIYSLNFSNTLFENLSINYNVGYAIETDQYKSGFYIANLSYEATNNLHFFVENFGDFTNKKLISHNLNIGGGYNFSNTYTFDLSIANGLNHNMFYLGGILTFVLNTSKT